MGKMGKHNLETNVSKSVTKADFLGGFIDLYFDSVNGSDLNDGLSADKPKRDIGKIHSILDNKVFSALNVYLANGTYASLLSIPYSCKIGSLKIVGASTAGVNLHSAIIRNVDLCVFSRLTMDSAQTVLIQIENSRCFIEGDVVIRRDAVTLNQYGVNASSSHLTFTGTIENLFWGIVADNSTVKCPTGKFINVTENVSIGGSIFANDNAATYDVDRDVGNTGHGSGIFAAKVNNGIVIESGSNANGSFTKFADGTLICRYVKPIHLFGQVQSHPNERYSLTFPVRFVGVPSASIEGYTSLGDGLPYINIDVRTGAVYEYEIYYFVGNPGNANYDRIINLSYIAIGRWK